MFEEYVGGLRELAESRMTSRATVHRINPADPATKNGAGFEVPNWIFVYADLPFRLGGSRGASGSHTVNVGGVEVEVATRVGHFPSGTSDLLDDDLIEVTDGENVGTVLRIVEASWADQQTARRVPVVEAQRPTEWA